MFSSLVTVEGLTVLDLCSGTGVLAVEALSRGAIEATCVERSSQNVGVIHRNMAIAGFGDRTTVLCRRAESFLKSPADRYNLVFADPPYRDELLIESIVEMVSASLTGGARFVLEHSSRGTLPIAPQSLILDRTRSHGDSAFTIYRPVDN
jgi:16S rRNA (guanine966-N2)-methyltransferase